MAPLAHNHTESGQKGQKGKGSVSSGIAHHGVSAQRRVEDLERELKRKMQVLEEERKTLRKEAKKHQQHIDHGLDAVHQRISSLEQGEKVRTRKGWIKGMNVLYEGVNKWLYRVNK